jgi:hypothetical protein
MKSEDICSWNLGILEPIEITQATWTEVGFKMECTKVEGYVLVQEAEVKNQSNFSRRGSYCILLQVNFLPFIGNSIIPK